ncbi:plasmid mobilization protein [Roseivirga pacifica]|uniref:plasmid mobilization protein n=1 Tax=Roseivirga pacifica TaxID=1267423 RepID=UPI003BAC3133
MKKSEVRQRTLIINFRVLPEERDVFEDRCQASGLSKSDYFRKKCLDEAPLRKRKALPVDVELLTRYLGQVGRIGNNLNQVAKGMNQGFLPSANELNETVQDIKELRAVIRKALGYDH